MDPETKVIALAEQVVDRAKRRRELLLGTWYEVDGELFEEFEQALHELAVAEGRAAS